MALANDMTDLLDKIENRLGLIPLTPHLPKGMQKEDWADRVIMKDSIVTFSRFFPYRFPLVINENTCDKKKERNVVWYYIKDEILQGTKLLGLKDIDWTDTSAANSSLANGSIGTYYYPAAAPCIDATFESMMALQFAADTASLYNRGITIDFQYPNRFSLKGLGNANYDLDSFVIILLVEHRSLSTISPTKMETFESLCQADIAKFLYNNLRYYDGMDTAYVNLDLKLSELQDVANQRDSIIEKMDEAHVQAANDEAPLIWTV